MAIKITKRIKGYSVKKPGDAAPAPMAAPEADAPEVMQLPKAEVIQMHEQIERPEVLIGSTYKIKSPLFEHALYVTINDIVLNPGTEHESRRPFEIFINSKNMDHFQWIVALTRIMSAVFRKGGDVTFLVEEMKAVFDPRGGYFKAGGIYMPSIVAEIGAVVEDHLKMIGMIVDPDMSVETKRLIAEKRAAFEAQQAKKKTELNSAGSTPAAKTTPAAADAVRRTAADAEAGSLAECDAYTVSKAGTGPSPSSPGQAEASAEGIPGAIMCPKCSAKALVIMDGCATCLSCGYSKCG